MRSRDAQVSNSRRCSEDVQAPACVRTSLSTARIMQAVEEQRRVSQQLEDLRIRQKQRTALLRTRGLKLIGVFWCLGGVLVGGFILLLLMRPDLLDRLLNTLDGSIALLVVLAEQARVTLAVIPENNWLLSLAALAVVLMAGLWIRLMRHPQDG